MQNFLLKKDANNLQQLIKNVSFNKKIIDQHDIIDSQAQIKQLYYVTIIIVYLLCLISIKL